MSRDMDQAIMGATSSAERADAGEFAVWVREGQARHKRLAFLLTGDLAQAEDLLQSAYAKTFPRWDKVRAYDVPDAYLRRVMISVRTSWWRRVRHHREWSTDTVPEVAGSDDLAGDVAQHQALLAALRTLPERQRAAVVLRHWCDLSEAETAAAMSCSRGTVKSNTSKGLTRLRQALGGSEGAAS